MRVAGRFHLTYCSNIHPGESWEEVRANLGRYLPRVREHLSLEGAFGIGLRLSGRAAATLERPDRMEEFRRFLSDGNYYVFTINGFPYGVFHGERVKEDVYLPDWLDEERLDYTNRLAVILAGLMPEDLEMPGSVSTSPGAFRDRVRSSGDVDAMATRILRHAVFLRELERSSGRRIALAIEPEPACHLETIDDVIGFFTERLLDPAFVDRATAGGIDIDTVRRHVGVCFDACHMAVEFEDPRDALARLRTSGIEVFKFQISSALKLVFRSGDGQAEARMRPFAESTYLHQVVERNEKGLVRYVDLPEALAAENARPAGDGMLEWRVHFHVPIFLDRMKGFDTSQDYLASLIDMIRVEGLCPCLEVETYTWDVLPAEYRDVDVTTAVARELSWVRKRIDGGPRP